jgi:hypothetical protein
MRVLLSCICVFGTFGVSHSAVVAVWNFNLDTLDVARTNAPISSASLTTNFDSVTYFTGTNVNRDGTDVAGRALGLQNGSGGVHNGRYLQIHLQSTIGLRDLSLSFASERSSTGFNSNQLFYSLDGGTFFSVGDPYTPSASWSIVSYDLSGVGALTGADDLYLRIVFSGGSTSSSTGSNKIDNLVLQAQPVPEPGTALAAAAAFGIAARRRRQRGRAPIAGS